MKVIDIYRPIGDFTLAELKEEVGSERAFRLDIHSVGGDVEEGFAIYDWLRTCGREVHTNIVGGCHSIATVILLAAPPENRTANPNARALIHKVRMSAPYMTREEAIQTGEELDLCTSMIRQVYVDRTRMTEAQAEDAMQAERELTTEQLLKFGFVSKINKYTNMKLNLKQKASRFIATGRIVNYDFTDPDGNVILSTAREDETLEVGDAVVLPNGETAGEVTLSDGRVVVVADGVIAEIREAAAPETENADEEQREEELTNLRAENSKMRKELEQVKNMLREMCSTYAAPERTTASKAAPMVEKPSVAEIRKNMEYCNK